MEKLKAEFPPGLEYSIVYDTTPFIKESIHEVYKTLCEAIVLVALVVLLFLQNWRSVLIPLIAVPVSLIGTFAVMAVLGFSLNNISLLGLVLAIGVVVDDAIVVVENVERWIEHGLSPKEAAYKSMEEVTVAVIAIAFGLSAVFIPTAFISGMSGPVLPAVRPDDRHLDAHLGVQLADAQPGLGRHPAEAARRQEGPAHAAAWISRCGWLFRGFNGAFNATHDGLRAARAAVPARHASSACWSMPACSSSPTTVSRPCPPASCPTRTRATCW